MITRIICWRKEKRIMMTKQEYVESLRKLNMVVYMFGERIESAADHPDQTVHEFCGGDIRAGR